MRGHGDIIPSKPPAPGALVKTVYDRASSLAAQGEAIRFAPTGGRGTPHEVLSSDGVRQATHFDPAWGRPPGRPGLSWVPERFLLMPVLADDLGPGGSLVQEHGLLVALAQRGYFRQWHREPGGAWGLRWVRALTEVPDPSVPYELVREEALPLRPR